MTGRKQEDKRYVSDLNFSFNPHWEREEDYDWEELLPAGIRARIKDRIKDRTAARLQRGH